MRIGNVIKAPDDGGMWIVTEVHDYGLKPTVSAVSFDSENVSAVQELEDHTRTDTCACGDNAERAGEPDEDCPDCRGTGSYMRRIKGWKHSKVLASSVREFILSKVRKAFAI